MEAGSLAELPVPGLEGLGSRRIGHDVVHPCPDLLHLLEVGELHDAGQVPAGPRRLVAQPVDQPSEDVGPAVVDEVPLGEATGGQEREVLHSLPLPPWLEGRGPCRIGRPVPPDVDGRGRALEHEQRAGRGGDVRDDLHGGGAGADDADALVAQARQAAVRVTSRVGVVPATGVKGMTRERIDAWDAGELGSVEGAIAHDEESRRHPVAPIGVDGPAQSGVVPRNARHLRRQARALVQIELPGDAPAVFEDLGGAGVLLAGHVRGLLEQRKVDVGLDVTLRARVPVPVPGASEVATLLNDAKVVDARLRESCAGDESGETTADDGDPHIVGQGWAIDRLRVGVLQVGFERTRHLDVLIVAVPPDPLVAFEPVLLAQRVGVEFRRSRGRVSVSVSHGREPRRPAAHVHRSFLHLGEGA